MKTYAIILIILVVVASVAIVSLVVQPPGVYDNNGVFHEFRSSPYAFAVPSGKTLDDAIIDRSGGLIGWGFSKMVNVVTDPGAAEAASPYSAAGTAAATGGASQPGTSGGTYPGGQQQYAQDVAAIIAAGMGKYSSGGGFAWVDPSAQKQYEKTIAERQAAADQAAKAGSFRAGVEQRPGFYPIVGDQRTGALVRQGFTVGGALEKQRQTARHVTTPHNFSN